MFLIVAKAGRTEDFTIEIKSPSGGYIQLADDDVVRIKLGRLGTVALDLDQSATAAGSLVTKSVLGNGSSAHAAVVLRLAQGDTSSFVGSYEAEVSVVDNSEIAPADAIKPVDSGHVEFTPQQSGDIGVG